MKLAAALLLLCLTTVACRAQQQPPELIATPNRPTVTNTAETTQFGVLEIEFGISAATRQQSLQGLLKFGLLRDVELDWAGNPWQHDASVHYVGVSDNNPGLRWRFLRQAKRRPTLTVEYSAKLPTAGRVEVSGEVDHIVTLLASKDFPKRFHVDANLGYTWLGRPGSGFDHYWQPTGTLSYALTHKWQLAMEFSGNDTRERHHACGHAEPLGGELHPQATPGAGQRSAVSRDRQRPPGRLPGRLHLLHC
jgi:hypothetical protein